MTRINCHSAFKHYEMFHANHCGGGNYGSIFNTTYNIDCGGHGGFWGGFGAGLGNAFGNLFGGWFGGGMGLGFGNFGNFGMGSFGFPSFGGGWGNFWGGGNAGGTAKTGDCSCGCKDTGSSTSKECKDADLKKINDYDTEVVALEKTPDEAKAKDLYKRIKDSMDKQDAAHKDENTIAYQKLLDRLKAKYPNIDGEGEGAQTQTQTQTPTTPVSTSGNEPTLVQTPTQPQTPVVTQTQAPAGNNTKKIADAATTEDLGKVPYDELSADDKKAYVDKYRELTDNLSPEDLRNALAKLPDNIRTAVKASFYNPGFKNLTYDEITEDTIKGLIEVIDTSEIADFTNIKDIKNFSKANGKISFTMVAASGTSVNYTQVIIEDGEIIFHGKQENQHYALQKDANGKLHLMQYKYHQGNGTADVN